MESVILPFVIQNASGVLCAVIDISSQIYSFIKDAIDVDQSLRALLNEVNALKDALVAVESVLKDPVLLQNHTTDRNLREVLKCTQNSLSRCQSTLEPFKKALDSINGSKPAGRNPFRHAIKQFKLDMQAPNMVHYRTQLGTHTSSMQISLQMLTVFISSRAPNVVISTLEPKLNVLIDLIADLDPHTSMDAIPTADDDQDIRESRIRLRRAAAMITSSTSTVISSRSTVWDGSVFDGDTIRSVSAHPEGSVASFTPLELEQRKHISQWTLDTTLEEPEEATTEQENSSPNTPSHDDDGLDPEIFRIIVTQGDRYYQEANFKEAAKRYSRAFNEAGANVPVDIRDDAKVKLAKAYVKAGEYDAARNLMMPVLGSSNGGRRSPANPNQVMQGALKLAEVFYGLDLSQNAERYAKQAMLASQRIHGRTSTSYAESVTLLAKVYEAIGDDVLVAAYRSMLPTPINSSKNMKDNDPKRSSVSDVSDHTLLLESSSSLEIPADTGRSSSNTTPINSISSPTSRKSRDFITRSLGNSSDKDETFSSIRNNYWTGSGSRGFELYPVEMERIWTTQSNQIVEGLVRLRQGDLKVKYLKAVDSKDHFDRQIAIKLAIKNGEITVLWILLFHYDILQQMWLHDTEVTTLSFSSDSHGPKFMSGLLDLLACACEEGCLDAVYMLLEFSYNTEAQQKFTSCLIHRAASRHHYHLFDVLLGNQHRLLKKQDIDSGIFGHNALYYTVSDGKDEAAACKLIKHGANVNLAFRAPFKYKPALPWKSTWEMMKKERSVLYWCKALGWVQAVAELDSRGAKM